MATLDLDEEDVAPSENEKENGTDVESTPLLCTGVSALEAVTANGESLGMVGMLGASAAPAARFFCRSMMRKFF